MVVLRRRVRERKGKPEEINSIYDLDGDPEGTEVPVYAFVIGESSIDTRETLNQGIDVGRRAQERKGEPQEINSIYDLNGNEEGAVVPVYAFVFDESSIDKRETQYQGLDEVTQDYDSMYTQLTRGTYQELDLHGREEEHHYQTPERGKK